MQHFTEKEEWMQRKQREQRRQRRSYTAAEFAEVWDRWDRGESSKSIARVLDREASISAPHYIPSAKKPFQVVVLSWQIFGLVFLHPYHAL